MAATATGNAVLRAYNTAAKKFDKDPGLIATLHSAGFIIPKQDKKRGEREGFQVFVKVARYSEALLRDDPDSGGVLEWATKKSKKRGNNQ